MSNRTTDPTVALVRRAGLHQRIHNAKFELENATREYLRAAGWKYSCENPAALWLWVKGQFALSESTALVMQEQEDAANGMFYEENDIEF